MTIEQIRQTSNENYAGIVNSIKALTGSSEKPTYEKQYDPKLHDINDSAKRRDKIVKSENGEVTAVKVARLPIPTQRVIVGRAATFLCGNPVELVCNPKDQLQKDMLEVVDKTMEDNKMDYVNKELAKLMMSETDCAELWYTQEADAGYWDNTPIARSKFKLRCKVLASSLGDILHPVYDEFGDMIAFAREYRVKIADKNILHFDLYTNDKIWLASSEGDTWTVESKPNIIGKIPVIYYRQARPEWFEVQEMIDRLEMLISRHADTNDYFGSPIITVTGKVQGFAKKGEDGKVLELENGATAQYLTWTQAPESVKLEIETLFRLIHSCTDTPDISFEQMKGLGTFSGIALKMLFLGAHMKASDKEELFGKSVQRRINYVKASMAKINLKLEKATVMTIKPKFEYYLPKDDEAKVNMLVTASGGQPIISKRTAVALNPLVEDAAQELLDMTSDALNNQFNQPLQ